MSDADGQSDRDSGFTANRLRVARFFLVLLLLRVSNRALG